MSGLVEAVCLVHADVALRDSESAIDKRPVDGPVEVTPLGLVGDHVVDTVHHGGIDQAVYAYAAEDADRWAVELGKAVPAGWFGENLRVRGLAVSDAVVGEIWRVGEVVLQVSAPRVPCANFQRWTGEAHWVRRFTLRGDTGAYLRVLRTGAIRAGDDIVVTAPEHGVTVRDLFTRSDPARMTRVLDEPSLNAEWRAKAAAAIS